MEDWFVYVIVNPKGLLYTGCCKGEAERRLAEHNAGAGAKISRGRGLWRLVHREGPFPDRGAAQSREIRLKADRAFKAALRGKIADS